MTLAPTIEDPTPLGNEPTPHQIERGLRVYVSQVATQVGAGHGSQWCEWAESANAYIALEDRLPDKPVRDLALIWDDERGWAVGMETGSGEDLLILAWHTEDLLPSPAAVARFARQVIDGSPPEQEAPGSARGPERNRLAARLAAYA